MLTYKRNGAMHFLRIGRFCFSFVVARSARPAEKVCKLRKLTYREGFVDGMSRAQAIAEAKAYLASFDQMGHDYIANETH